MTIYSISISIPKAAGIILTQLTRILQQTAYSRDITSSKGSISEDLTSIQWDIEGKITFHEVNCFINDITRYLPLEYSYTITQQSLN